MKNPGLLLVLLSLLLVPAVGAENLAALFPFQAPITADGPGLARLELSPEVLGACRADLADLRVLSAPGTEIPYLIDSPDPAGLHLEVDYRATPEVLSAGRTQQATDRRTTAYREEFLLSLPLLPDEIAAWELVLAVRQVEFVAKIDITAFSQGEHQTPVVIGGSAFRLPSANAEKLRFLIPVRDAAKVMIKVEGQDQGFLSPSFTLEGSRLLPSSGTSAIELETIDRREHPGHTEVVVERPRGFVPRRLSLQTTTGTYHRKVTVWDEGPGASPDPLGSRAVLRIDAIAPIEVQEIPLKPARGGRLRIVIENQDSPALENLSISALIPRPILVFSLPEDGTTATLVFGGGRAHRPQYDLLALDPKHSLPVAGDRAEQAIALLDPSRARLARLGEIRPNAEYDTSPALAFAMHPGAEIDSRFYSHRRRLEVAPSAEGLSRLQLEPEDLALLRSDLADLRVVDAEGRQWAFLKQDHARVTHIRLLMANHRVVDHLSRYRLDIPKAPITTARVDIETPAPYFDRDYRLLGTLENGNERVLSSGRLIRKIGDPRPVTISFTSTRLMELELEVMDGNDSPLNFSAFTARLAVADVYLAATAGTFDLLLGYPEAEYPRYELERVRSTVLAVPAAGVAVGPLEANPDYSSTRRLSDAANMQKILLWVILGLAVLVLGALTLRAARQDSNQA
ncbi:MAG: DUF3999 domain-containing protein [Thermoanaerobaculales bacterium]|nr:DUF3999 domain-containing protein [Thermoanaerobaculales bacterium]